MSESVAYFLNKASEAEIAEHLLRCDADFVPPLRGRVDIKDYAHKIESKAVRFEAWSDGALVGLAAFYCNDRESKIAYITSVSVLRELMGKGIATQLMSRCAEYAKVSGMRLISLQVASDNAVAIKLYEKSGFVADKADTLFITMNLYLKNKEDHE